MAKKIGGLGKGLSAIFSENDTEDKNEVVTLKISQIEPNRNQPRRTFDEDALQELALSISEHGVLQPILVRPMIYGGYQIVAGERRYRASRMAGLTEIPAIVRELTDRGLNYYENHRYDLDRREMCEKLFETKGLSKDVKAANRVWGTPLAMANKLLLTYTPLPMEMLESSAPESGALTKEFSPIFPANNSLISSLYPGSR